MLKLSKMLPLTFLLFGLGACVSFKKPHDSSEPLDIVSRIKNLDTAINIERLPGEPPVYRLGNHATITALRDCKFGQRVSLSGLNRQVLVGLEKLQFQEQAVISIGNHEFMYSQVEAQQSPRLRLAVYSGIVDSCLVDYVIWTETGSPLTEFEDSKRTLIQLIQMTLRD